MNTDCESIYCLPDQAIVSIVDTPPDPTVSLNPTKSHLLIMQPASLPTIQEVAGPELRLAGMRFNPQTNGPSRSSYYTSLTLKKITSGAQQLVTGLPEGARIQSLQWSPGGMHVAFTITNESSITLWIAQVQSGEARKLADLRLNGMFGSGFCWDSDGQGLICLAIPAARGAAPATDLAPTGPIVQENMGKTASAWTHQDLLKNSLDEDIFQYYAGSQMVRVGLEGHVKKLSPEALYTRAKPSPDGKYILANVLQRPFSYLVPYARFAHQVLVFDAQGKKVFEAANLPVAEDVPTSRDAVSTGRRQFGWRSDAQATLYWVVAKDQGDPRIQADVRDQVCTLAAPFSAEPAILASLASRFSGILWGSGSHALVTEKWWQTRLERTWVISPDTPDLQPQLLFDRSVEDIYSDPGKPLTTYTTQGDRVLLIDQTEAIFFVGSGFAPDGAQPFLDRLTLDDLQTQRLWQSNEPYYEYPVSFLDDQQQVLLTRRESSQEPPNYFMRNLATEKVTVLTSFPHPNPKLKNLQKKFLRYQRDDGVELTATLYLPPDYQMGDGPLPLLLWAYPREYKNAAAAGQNKDTPYRFMSIAARQESHLALLTQGYAILDGPTMPIVGEGDQQPNDTYIEQLTASAKAAVEEVVRLGVAERGRIAVGGHSYGAFMTANLLTHTDLFAAGIARSGAYNRTLTPFGFQAEERTLWDVPDVYLAMSPYIHVKQVDAPLLLIHGTLDSNSGTFPMQSERYFNALKGHGKTTRLVMLPYEDHGYRARESVLHMFWEMTTWLAMYLKPDTPR